MSGEHVPDLNTVFSPSSVAIVGASPDNPFSFPGFLICALKETGFYAIYPVNPKHKEAFGLKCYPSVSSIPGRVDHVVVSIPAEKSLEILDDCARKGVNSVHFFSAGFSESGEKDRVELEQAMLKKARTGKFRIIGPNSTGLFIPKARFAPATRLPMEPGHVAFISQSGGHAQELPLHAGQRGVRFSKVISYGNALDIDECELLEYFTDDPETQIIGMYIEGVRNGRHFHELLKKASVLKPVVIYKGGVTEAGLRTAHSHTASITSSVRVFQSLCHQLNAIQVDDIQELIDILVALSFVSPYPQGKGVAVLGQGGGPSVQASDQMERAGLTLTPLSRKISVKLREFLPPAGAIYSNPLDATNLVNPEIIYRTLKVLAESSDVDFMMYHLGFHPVTRWGEGLISSDRFLKPAVENIVKASRESKKPVLMALGPASDKSGMEEMLAVRDAFVRAGLPVFHSIEKAALAMSRIVNWQRRFGKLK